MSWGADQNGEILGRAWQSRASTSDTTLPKSLLIATAAGRCALYLAVTLSMDWSDLLSGRGPHE